MRTHGAVVGRRFRSVTKLTTKVRIGRGYLWGSFLIVAAALKTPTRNGYNAQGVNLNFPPQSRQRRSFTLSGQPQLRGIVCRVYKDERIQLDSHPNDSDSYKHPSPKQPLFLQSRQRRSFSLSGQPQPRSMEHVYRWMDTFRHAPQW